MVLQEERRDGIDVRTEEEIAEIVGKNGQVVGVITSRGERIPCEMVLIAIGIEPLIDFIRASGIVCGRGVKVDNGMRTHVSDIYAAGDVIETTDEFTGRTRVRIPLSTLTPRDRKSTRLNSSHQIISYAVFCLKKKNKSK